MDEKILDRIQKLLALATSDNVNESAAAAGKAQELMTKYKIELADLQASTPGAVGESILNDELFREKSLIKWKTHLAAGLAEANGCKVYTLGLRYTDGKKAGDVCRIIGTSSSLSTVRYMYAYLVREVDRLAALNRAGHDRAWLNSFRMGAVGIITKRLFDSVKETKQEASTGALAVINKDALRVQEEISALRLKQGSPTAIKDSSGFSAGAKAGQNVKISSGPSLGRGAKGDLKS